MAFADQRAHAAEMPAGAFLDSTNAWPRLVPFFETVFMRTAGPESAEERKRREDALTIRHVKTKYADMNARMHKKYQA